MSDINELIDNSVKQDNPNDVSTLLDDLVKLTGEKVENIKIVDSSTVLNKIKEPVHFAYDDGFNIMPGENVNFLPTVKLDMTENEANDMLIKNAAIAKLNKEYAANKLKSDELRVKEYYIESVVRNLENAYFNEYHYEMSGPQKKHLRKYITSHYGKGKYKISRKLFDEILYNINLSSNDENKNVSNPMVNNLGTSLNINLLMSGSL